MITNYLLIALRNLQRNTTYSIINIAGLSIGLACGMLILLWVSDELSYNQFHSDYDNVYQVMENQKFNGKIETSQQAPYPLAEALRNSSSKIKHVAMINHGEGYLLSTDKNQITKTAYFVDREFLEIFDFNVLRGNKATMLGDQNSVVLTQSTARALFGTDDVLSKVVRLDNSRELNITGVIEDVPQQSSIQFEFLLPFSYFEATQAWVRESKQNWNNSSFRIFVELEPEASLEDVHGSIKDLVKKNNAKSPTAEVWLHPMSEWRLYTEFTNGRASGGIIEYVQLFSAIGIFIVIIACINFMNLATARSQSRAREVGIRKSVGSRRKQLITQFLGESLLITTIAFALGVVMVEFVLPFYSVFVNKTLSIEYANPRLWVGAFLMIFITGLIAGSYPAFYLSSFQPVKVLKGKIQGDRGSATPRKILVMLQFGFSIFLIIGTLTIYQQIMHVQARHIGYDRENLLLFWTTTAREKNFQNLRNELEKTGVVASVCKSSSPITRIFSSSADVSWPGKINDDKIAFTTVATEYDYTKTMGIKMLEGRDFSQDFPGDSTSLVINQAALEIMGFKNPIGQKVSVWGTERTIVGVMENVVMGSPYEPVDPLTLVFIPSWSSTISVRMEPAKDMTTAVNKIESVFKKIDPDNPLWYRFADSEFDSKFSSINLIGQLSWIFTLLAIVISSLGLFGLAAFSAEQRTKELGIRKVMGASIASLVALMTKDFSKLVFFAFIISAPIAWLLLNEFLQQYPYRISLPWWILPMSGSGALLLAVIIVSTQAMRAAMRNPVNSLRSE